MHASFASITTEVDVDPTLVMFGVSFEDEDEDEDDDAPTCQVAPPSELLARNLARESMASLPDEEVPVIQFSTVEVAAEVAAERPAFALELLPVQPSALARMGRAVARWAPYAALGAAAGLLLCIGASAFADAITAPKTAPASPVIHVASPSVPATLAHVVAPTDAAEVIELDEGRTAGTVARRARPISPASRPVARVGTSARLPPLAAMPAQYTKW